jgi:predicted metal-binding protein
MTEHTLLVCSLCRFSETQNKRHGLSGGQYLIEELQKGLESYNLSDYPSGTLKDSLRPKGLASASVALRDRITIKPVSCMAACRRSCTATLAANDKLTFIFNQLAPIESAPELLQFVEQYVTSPNGKVPYQERSTTIKQATAFILPPLPNSP